MTLTHKNILDYCNYLINKDQVADPISPEEYNAIIPVVNIEVYNREKQRLLQLAQGQHMKFVELVRDSYLQDVKREYDDEGGVTYQLPGNCDYLLTVRAITDNYGVKVNLVSEDKAYEMANGLVDGSDAIYAYQVGKNLKMSVVSNSVWMIYLAIPETPVFDYYIDSDNNFQYLPVGATVQQSTTYGSGWDVQVNGTVIATNINYPNSQHTSKSKEFAWRDSVTTTIVNLIFEKMGINIREQLPIEMSQLKKGEVE
jgi:hypothetical protein